MRSNTHDMAFFPHSHGTYHPSAAALDALRAAAACAAAIGIFAVLGTLKGLGLPLGAFDLGGEWNVPALFSAALLVADAALSVELARRAGARSERLVAGLGVFFLVMAADELFQFHESLTAETGIDWQLVYLPIVLVAAIAWLSALRLMRGVPLARLMWVAAPGAWLVAQVLEHFEWDGPELVFGWMIIPEEALEMTGSALFMVALLSAVRARRRQSPQ